MRLYAGIIIRIIRDIWLICSVLMFIQLAMVVYLGYPWHAILGITIALVVLSSATFLMFTRPGEVIEWLYSERR